MPAITLRTAGPADAILLAEMGRETFSASFAAQNTPENMATYLQASFSPEKQASELAQAGSFFLIAEIDGIPAGYVRLLEGSTEAGIAGQHPIELVRIYACRPWIGSGVGSALMRASLEQARQLECDVIWLGVWEQNPHAIEFYRRWGFVPVGTHPFLLGDELQTDWIMQRPVTEENRG